MGGLPPSRRGKHYYLASLLGHVSGDRDRENWGSGGLCSPWEQALGQPGFWEQKRAPPPQPSQERYLKASQDFSLGSHRSSETPCLSDLASLQGRIWVWEFTL